MESSQNNEKLASFFNKTYNINSQELQELINLSYDLIERSQIFKSSNSESSVTRSIATRELNISNCKIDNQILKDICEAYADVLPFFTSIILDDNNILELPESFYSANRDVLKISIANNSLKKLPNLQQLPKLASLDVSDNEIEQIFISNNHCLKNLIAQGNNLKSFQIHSENNNLTSADLRRNHNLKILEIDVLTYPNSLTIICDEKAKGENVNRHCTKKERCEGLIKFDNEELESQKETPKNSITLAEALKTFKFPVMKSGKAYF